MSTTTDSPTLNADRIAQDDLDKVALAIRAHIEQKHDDYASIQRARAEAVVMATSYTELVDGKPQVVEQGLYSADDVIDWITRALELGATTPQINRSTIERLFRSEIVPNVVFREELERRGLGLAGFAELLGIDAGTFHATRDLARKLGKETCPGRKGYEDTLRLFIPYDLAAVYAAALGLNPHDCGL